MFRINSTLNVTLINVIFQTGHSNREYLIHSFFYWIIACVFLTICGQLIEKLRCFNLRDQLSMPITGLVRIMFSCGLKMVQITVQYDCNHLYIRPLKFGGYAYTHNKLGIHLICAKTFQSHPILSG